MIDKKQIYVCGNNDEGQLGLGDTKYRNIPQKLGFNNIKLLHNQNFFKVKKNIMTISIL